MAAALRSSFHAVDREVLQRAGDEQGRDGATAVVILRTGECVALCLTCAMAIIFDGIGQHAVMLAVPAVGQSGQVAYDHGV